MNLKIICFLSFLICISNVRNANAQWLQVKQASSVGYIKSNDIAVDSLGNIYIVGMLTGDSYFDSSFIHCQTDGDYFIAKYNSTGSLMWVKSGAGFSVVDGEQTGALSIAIGGVNEIFVTGAYSGTIDFDGITLTSRGVDDIFIIQLDSSSNINWAKSAGGNNGDAGVAIEIDKEKNIYVTGNIGTYLSNVYFETDTIPMSTISFYKAFLAKYDALGNLIWVKSSDGPGSNSGCNLSCYKSSIFVIGTYDSLSIFDNTNLTSTGRNDVFILEYDSSGNVQWGISSGGPTSNDDCTGIGVDSSGNCFIVGEFEDSILFDTTLLECSGVYDCFIAKYSSNGNFIWAKQLQSSQHSIAYGISTDLNGYSYITGEFKGSALFGNIILNSFPYHDMFVARYDSGGNCLGVRQVINSSGSSITKDMNGLLYTTGWFVDTAVFDSYTLYENLYMGIFWAKLDAIIGIQENDNNANNELVIYANPSHGKCNISVPKEFLHEKFLTLSIFDNNGRVIQNSRMQMDEDKISIDLRAEAKGVYNVNLSNGEKSYAGKIIFE